MRPGGNFPSLPRRTSLPAVRRSQAARGDRAQDRKAPDHRRRVPNCRRQAPRLLRTAHVRVIGPASDNFWIYSKMRGDSESLNRKIEDSLYRNHRARSVGWARQQIDMIGLAGLINALSRERIRRSRRLQAA